MYIWEISLFYEINFNYYTYNGFLKESLTYLGHINLS